MQHLTDRTCKSTKIKKFFLKKYTSNLKKKKGKKHAAHFKVKCCDYVFLPQVYHISRNTWFKMETRMIKNVCAPAVVLGERIVIVGGEFEQRMESGHQRGISHGKSVADRQMLFSGTVFFFF